MRTEMPQDVIQDAKAFLRSIDAGILSTLHDIDGEAFPFGSMCPFVLSLEGEIIILISDIAMHTKNIKSDDKVAFTVFNPNAEYKQGSGRISLVGRATLVEDESEKYIQVRERYLKFFPRAKGYFKTHDFHFYTIKPVKAHYVQTFGKIYTFDGTLLADTLPEWVGQEQSVLDHMNQDHKSALAKYMDKTEYTYNKETDEFTLHEIDQHGFHLANQEGKFYYMNFPKQANTFTDLREQFTNMARS